MYVCIDMNCKFLANNSSLCTSMFYIYQLQIMQKLVIMYVCMDINCKLSNKSSLCMFVYQLEIIQQIVIMFVVYINYKLSKKSSLCSYINCELFNKSSLCLLYNCIPIANYATINKKNRHYVCVYISIS
uniref:Transmembrane protein n=1 Tax=Cacopsylla melanoneura TaxID=428564 RepID=A0A8D8ZYQ8_9HEMI